MNEHELKTDSAVFWDVVQKKKDFEIRYNDRDFAVSDKLRLRETYATGEQMKEGSRTVYTGLETIVTVKYIMRGPIYGLKDGWVILGIV